MLLRTALPATLALCALGLGVPSPSLAEGSAAVVLSDEPLAPSLWIPGTGDARRLTYTTVGATGAPATSSGAMFLPKGTPPPGGWPVVAWAHGTVGLADQCAPSVAGPLLAERDRAYLASWLGDGYAILASDYTGLGTPGVMPYLNGKITAHNVADMTRAAAVAYPASISRRWVVVGQSQGGAAAVTTARYATQFGGPGLDYRGAVATGVPAYTESLIGLLGPWIPPFPLSPQFTTYTLYILAGLRATYPNLNIDGYLTPQGKTYVDLAEQLCGLDLESRVANVVVGKLFTKPLAALPNAQGLLKDYMGLPERGFDRPLFVGQGTKDGDIPTPLTYAWALKMFTGGQPITFRTYPTDHSGTMAASLVDSRPFVRRAFGLPALAAGV